MPGAAVTLPSCITRSPATVEALTCFCFANAVYPLQSKFTDEIDDARRALALGLGEDRKGASGYVCVMPSPALQVTFLFNFNLIPGL